MTAGQVAAHRSSSAAELADHGSLQQGRPVGLRRAGLRASRTAWLSSSIALANNATLATVAANYGLKTTVVDQHPRHSGEDHAAGGGHQGGQRSWGPWWPGPPPGGASAPPSFDQLAPSPPSHKSKRVSWYM